VTLTKWLQADAKQRLVTRKVAAKIHKISEPPKDFGIFLTFLMQKFVQRFAHSYTLLYI